MLVPSYRRAVDMYNDQVKESNIGSQMGGENDDDWCAPSVSERGFEDDDEEEVLVEKEDSNGGKSIFRADKDGSSANSAGAEVGKVVQTPKSKAEDEYEDMTMEDYEDDSLALDDDCVVATAGGEKSLSGGGNFNSHSGIVLARRYDVSITYGKMSNIMLQTESVLWNCFLYIYMHIC